MIIAEATQISPQGKGYVSTPGIYNVEQVQAWKKITQAVHDEGGRIFLQLWHVGRISHPDLQPGGALPVAPSAVLPAGNAFTASGFVPFVTPRALETAEIAGLRLEAPQNDLDPATLYGGAEKGYIDYPFLEAQAAA